MIAPYVQEWTELDVKLLSVPGRPIVRTMAFPKMPRGWRESLAPTDQAALLTHSGYQFVSTLDHADLLEKAFYFLETLAGSPWTVHQGPYFDRHGGVWRPFRHNPSIADQGTWFRLPWPGIDAAPVIAHLERVLRRSARAGTPRSEVGIMEEIIVLEPQELKGAMAFEAMQ